MLLSGGAAAILRKDLSVAQDDPYTAGCSPSYPVVTCAPQGAESLGQLGLIKKATGAGRGEVPSLTETHWLRRCD